MACAPMISNSHHFEIRKKKCQMFFFSSNHYYHDDFQVVKFFVLLCFDEFSELADARSEALGAVTDSKSSCFLLSPAYYQKNNEIQWWRNCGYVVEKSLNLNSNLMYKITLRISNLKGYVLCISYSKVVQFINEQYIAGMQQGSKIRRGS